MAPVNRRTVVAGVVLTGATALVLLIVCLLQDRPVVHLTLLFAFLLGAGGATILGAVLAVRRKLPFGVRSLRAQLVILCVMTALMGLVTSGFTTALMLLSTQDLAILAGLLGYSLAVSVIVAFAFADTTAGSIGGVLAALRSMNTGNLDVRVKARSPDEVGELAEAVNALARRLQASLSRERDLIRDVSHDLRTPLAAIRAMVESVNDGVVDDPETVRRYLRATQLELEQLTRLINDLFDLSQLDAGALELRIEPASIGDLISDTIESMSAQAAARGLALDGRVDADLPALMMDAQRVQRVLNNLVDNAIRHTPPRGAVFIEARDVGPVVRVDVRDTGEGLPEEEFSRLLDAARGGEGSRSRPGGGSGLGLGIVIGIVQAHGGRVWLESAAGEGSRFSFTLPKSSAGSPSDVPAIGQSPSV